MVDRLHTGPSLNVSISVVTANHIETIKNMFVPVWLSGRALRQERKRLWVRFPGNTYTNENV